MKVNVYTAFDIAYIYIDGCRTVDRIMPAGPLRTASLFLRTNISIDGASGIRSTDRQKAYKRVFFNNTKSLANK